jgi:hypothetical protein
VSLWALASLRWTLTLPQASILVRLLTQAAASGGLDMRHACVLLYSLGGVRLRLPAPVLQYLMSNLAAGMSGASMADLLQVTLLQGCLVPWGGVQVALSSAVCSCRQQGVVLTRMHVGDVS